MKEFDQISILKMVNLEVLKLSNHNLKVIRGESVNLPKSEKTHMTLYNNLSKEQLIKIICLQKNCILNILDELNINEKDV